MNPIPLPITELKPALAGLGKVISRRTTLPVLSHVRVERTRHGRLELAVTDLDTSAIAILDTPAQGEPLSLLIPYEELNNTAKTCGRDDTLILAPVEKQRVAIYGANANASAPSPLSSTSTALPLASPRSLAG